MELLGNVLLYINKELMDINQKLFQITKKYIIFANDECCIWGKNLAPKLHKTSQKRFFSFTSYNKISTIPGCIINNT